jgi:hypothetical protein
MIEKLFELSEKVTAGRPKQWWLFLLQRWGVKT